MNLVQHETSDNPAIKIEASSPADLGSLVITVEAATATSPPYVRVYDRESKLSEILSISVAKVFNDTDLERVISDTLEKIDEARFHVNHPNNITQNKLVEYESVVRGEKDIYNDGVVFVLKGYESKDFQRPFLPYLEWIGSDVALNQDGIGWRLSLSGYEEVDLGFARWDEKEKILKLIESMSDIASLTAMASLLSPTESAKLVAEERAFVFLTNSEQINKDDIKKVFQDNTVFSFKENILNNNISVLSLSFRGIALAYKLELFTDPIQGESLNRVYPDIEEPRLSLWQRIVKIFYTPSPYDTLVNEIKSVGNEEKDAEWLDEELNEPNEWATVFTNDAEKMGFNVTQSKLGKEVKSLLVYKISKEDWDTYILPVEDSLETEQTWRSPF